jgi:hypothetical protein
MCVGRSVKSADFGSAEEWAQWKQIARSSPGRALVMRGRVWRLALFFATTAGVVLAGGASVRPF